jgi:predicted nucleotidyltransferase component of viral defense system
MTDQFFTYVLTNKTAELLSRFQVEKPEFLKSFYLSGGTALALQIGHRESEDLDFFSATNFEPEQLEVSLANFGELQETVLSENTLNTYLDSVKLQFLGYSYRLIEPLVDWGRLKLSSVVDIAATKLQTVSMRGNKKDFVDLFFLLERYSLGELFEFVNRKYSEANYNPVHILKSLTYFEDANNQPMPRMHKKVEWETVKREIVERVKRFQF